MITKLVPVFDSANSYPNEHHALEVKSWRAPSGVAMIELKFTLWDENGERIERTLDFRQEEFLYAINAPLK